MEINLGVSINSFVVKDPGSTAQRPCCLGDLPSFFFSL